MMMDCFDGEEIHTPLMEYILFEFVVPAVMVAIDVSLFSICWKRWLLSAVKSGM